MVFVYAFLVIAAIKLAINARKYFATKRFMGKYADWFGSEDSNLIQYRVQVERLITEAGVPDHYVPNVQPVGYGYVSTGMVSVLANFPHNRRDIAESTFAMFHHAIGVYRSRIYETFNPLYWLESLVNLPKNVFSYLGVSSESVVTKIFQLLWWVVGSAAAIVYGLYKTDADGFIRGFIDDLLQR